MKKLHSLVEITLCSLFITDQFRNQFNSSILDKCSNLTFSKTESLELKISFLLLDSFLSLMRIS